MELKPDTDKMRLNTWRMEYYKKFAIPFGSIFFAFLAFLAFCTDVWRAIAGHWGGIPKGAEDSLLLELGSHYAPTRFYNCSPGQAFKV